jgi:hypothetical protein
MGRADFLLLGDWNVTCYQCGFKDKASRMVRNWQGYYVHPEHNEPRQTQDFVRGVPDNQIPPWVQPWPAAIYTYVNQTMGFGDGVTKQFQLGSGVDNVTVTGVFVDGVAASYTANATGLCTITPAPALNTRITGNGSETAQ